MAKKKNVIPVFPLPEVVMFPEMNLPLHIFEDRYKQLVSDCLKTDKQFGIVLAKENNFYAKVGTLVKIIDIENLEDGTMNIFTEGRERFEIINFITEEPYHVAEIQPYEDTDTEIDDKLKLSLKQIKQLAAKALKTFDLLSEEEHSEKIKLPNKPYELLFLITTNLTCSHEEKQMILETLDLRVRLQKVITMLQKDIQRLKALQKIQDVLGDEKAKLN